MTGRLVFVLEKLITPDGPRARILSIDGVPPELSDVEVVELFGSCRRLTDRHDYEFKELWFDEILA